MKGRKPKPTHLKIIDGNPGKRKINKAEPKPPPVAPSCPDFLDSAAKAEWKYIAPKLEALSLLTKIDRAALVIYCAAWSDLKDARKFINENGKTYTTVVRDKWGQEVSEKIVEYPQVRLAREAEKMIHKVIAEFGMTPSSRSRMTLPAEMDHEDDMEKLLSEK